jgi:hypothetical protein
MSSAIEHLQISKHTQQMVEVSSYSCLINSVVPMVIIMKLKYNYEDPLGAGASVSSNLMFETLFILVNAMFRKFPYRLSRVHASVVFDKAHRRYCGQRHYYSSKVNNLFTLYCTFSLVPSKIQTVVA